MASFVEKNNVKIGVIAVPADFAQDIVDIMVNSGIVAILNFAPKVVSVPYYVEYRNVDLAVNMEVLSFNMTSQK